MTEYSKDELFQCICECMAESLPNNWDTAYMQSQVEGNNIHASYRYTTSSSNEELEFKTNNVFAPLNAAKALHQVLANEGLSFTNVMVRIFKDGNFEVSTQ